MFRIRFGILNFCLEFKNLSDEEKLIKFGGLLKLYQVQVDYLSKRSAAVEDFTRNYAETISKLPDPSDILRVCYFYFTTNTIKLK